MPRIRSVKPEFFQSEKIGKLPVNARYLFLGMLGQAGDNGTMRDDPLLLRHAVFPRDTNITDEDVSSWVSQMIELGLVERVEAVEYGLKRDRETGKQQQIGIVTVWKMIGFTDHQVINRPSLLRYVPVSDVLSSPVHDSSMTTHGTLSEYSVPTHEGEVEEEVEEDKDLLIDIPKMTTSKNRFDEFWMSYKASSAKSVKSTSSTAYTKAMKVISHEDLMLFAAAQVKEWQETGDIPCHWTTWLNQTRWERFAEAIEQAKPREVDPSFVCQMCDKWIKGMDSHVCIGGLVVEHGQVV